MVLRFGHKSYHHTQHCFSAYARTRIEFAVAIVGLISVIVEIEA